MTLNTLAKEIHENAKNKHWWDSTRHTGEIIALIHSELSEALEEARKDNYTLYLLEKSENKEVHAPSDTLHTLIQSNPANYKPEGLPVELADVIIRVLDFSEYMGYDMDSIVRMKMRYNETRPAKHGKIF